MGLGTSAQPKLLGAHSEPLTLSEEPGAQCSSLVRDSHGQEVSPCTEAHASLSGK